MKSPGNMKIIQIELTNACSNRCANCTRFCGHQRRPFFMDFDTFQKAVDSMADFSGIVGIMGGEPTLHPDFDKFVRYYKEHFGSDEKPNNIFKGPASDFIDYIWKNKVNINVNNKRGLWSSMGPKYYRYFELIQDTFGYQCLNDHSYSSFHETLMVTRKELGIPDIEWYALRDKCWIQSIWSASITPKGAFFCEVAAALDMLFDGPGGWPIEPGWWKRKPSEFGDQLQWCELCSASLAMPKRDANKEIDDASPVWCAMLEKIQSPKYLQGKVQQFDIKSYNKDNYSIINESIPYLQDQSKRLENRNGGLEPHNLSIWLDIRDSDPKNGLELVKHNRAYTKIDGIIVIEDMLSDELISFNIPLIQLPYTTQKGSVLQIASVAKARDFVLVLNNYSLRGDPREVIGHFVYNPGNYYYHIADGTVDCTLFNLRASSLSENPEFDRMREVYPSHKQVGLTSIPDQIIARYQTCYNPSNRIIDDIFHLIQNLGRLKHYFHRMSGKVKKKR